MSLCYKSATFLFPGMFHYHYTYMDNPNPTNSESLALRTPNSENTKKAKVRPQTPTTTMRKVGDEIKRINLFLDIRPNKYAKRLVFGCINIEIDFLCIGNSQ